MSLLASSYWLPVSGGITAPIGFKASGISAGLKSSGNLDLALVLVPQGTVCAGTFTQSLVRASCVDLCIERIQSCQGLVRALLINSGHANACTGKRGHLDNLLITETLAKKLGLVSEEVIICSTGVIGVPIPIDNLLNAINPLIQSLSTNGGNAASNAILTTDLIDKQIAFEAVLGNRTVRIGGMAKGSGMIHPNMATMLGYLTCDASVPLTIWEGMIKRIVASSFNAITVDGDTSTNDSFIAFAAGEMIEEEYFPLLEEGLLSVAQHLAKLIARDGEGANCLLEVQVHGTMSDTEARKIARVIASSSLVKTAVHGCDPNWGRIIAAAGCSGVLFDPSKLSLWLGTHQLMKDGQPIYFDEKLVSEYMTNCLNLDNANFDSLEIRLLVGDGNGAGFAWGCDLSDEYIRINADYTT